MLYEVLRTPDEYRFEYGENEEGSAKLRFEKGQGLKIFVSCTDATLKTVYLRWNERTDGEVKVLGDGWERLYGDAEWRGIVPERVMPWYMLVTTGKTTQGVGVKVRPNAICNFELDRSGITLIVDVRSAGEGVRLGERELFACELVSACYEGVSPFEAAKRFCRVMSDSPALPSFPVYGSNNWYYAYGDSSHKDILEDSKFVSELTKGLENRPFMVIDDGWSPHMTCGPWDRGNEKFPDMPRLAREMKEIGARPGIWIRSLLDDSPFSQSGHTLPGHDKTLDPTDQATLGFIRETVERLRDWGFELVKHDFSSVDLSGNHGQRRREYARDDRRFGDNSRTTAEVAKDVYKTIYDAAKGMIVLGCNCINHLVVGYAHLNRTGDDTSGYEWERTRKMGVNALAFRMCQDESFFKVDADCVGLTRYVPWEKNAQWLELLSRSGTPLFVSAKIDDCTDEIKEALRQAFAIASVERPTAEPLDWTYSTCPAKWRFSDGEKTFNWDDVVGVDC